MLHATDNPGNGSFHSAPANPSPFWFPVILLAGTLLRTLAAWPSEVWLDEANGILLASSPFSAWADVLALDSSPPLYYLVLRVFATLSLSSFWLRIPSLLAGVLTLVLVHQVCTVLHSRRCGLLATALLAFSPLHVFYSGELRMYSLLGLLALGFWYLLLLRPSLPRYPFATTLCGLGLCLTHHYALPFVAVSLALALCLSERRRSALLVALGLAIGYLPFATILSDQLVNPDHIAWIRPFWEDYPGGVALFRSLQAFLPGGSLPSYVPLSGLPAQAAVLGLPMLFMGLALFTGGRAGLSRLALLTASVGLPLSALVFVSYVFRPIYLAGRSDVLVLPLFVCLLALLYVRLPRTFLILALGLYLLLGGLQGWNSWPRWSKPGNAELAASIRTAACDTVLCSGLSYAAMTYYGRLSTPGWETLAFPPEIADHPGNFASSAWPLEKLGDAARRALLDLEAAKGRSCVLLSHASYAVPLAGALQRRGSVTVVREDLRSSLQREPFSLLVLGELGSSGNSGGP